MAENKKTYQYQDFIDRVAVDRSAPFNPTSAFPLDARSLFDSLELAKQAAQSAQTVGSKDVVYYHGQLVGVLEYPDGIDKPAKGVATYYVIQPNGSLSPIGSGSGSSVGLEFSEPVFNDQLQQWCCGVTGLGDCQDTAVIIPETAPSGAVVTEIAADAFISTGLKKVTIPDTVLYIKNSAFYGCEQLTSVVLSNNLLDIEDYAFYDCSNLLQLDLPPQLNSLGANALNGCSKLVTLSIPDSIQWLPARLCARCSQLKSCILPKNINLNSPSVFEGCVSLQVIYYKGDRASWGVLPRDWTLWSRDGEAWFIQPTSEFEELTSLTIVYNFASGDGEINLKLDSMLTEATKYADTQVSALSLDTANKFLETNNTVSQNQQTLSQTITSLGQTVDGQFKTLNEDLANKFSAVSDAADESLFTLTEIDSEDESYCLKLDPSVFNSNNSNNT
jgi:hypothetical protein